MSVVIDYEEAGPWRKRLTIEVPAPAVDAETGRAVKEIGRTIQLPGFRRGKVPASLIRRRFADEIERQVTETLVPRYWRQAEAEKSLDTLTQPEVEEVDFKPGEPMTFVAVVETRPEIELKNVDDFTLPEDEVEPTSEEVEQELRELRRGQADWLPVERPAATGDRVLGHVYEIANETEEPAPQPMRVEIGAEGVDEELSLALTGLEAGKSTTFRRRVDPDPESPEREYRIEVTEVQQQVLPELDDAFASVIGFDDLAELEKAVKTRLHDAKTQALHRRQEKALLEQLRDRHPLELPQGVVDQEVDRLLRDQAHQLSSQGIDIEHADIDWRALADRARPQAQQRVHERLLLDAIAKAKGIRLDEQEFERLLAEIARQQHKSSLVVRQELDAAGRLPELRAQMLERQTVRHLLGRNESAENASDPSDEPDPADESDTSDHS